MFRTDDRANAGDGAMAQKGLYRVAKHRAAAERQVLFRYFTAEASARASCYDQGNGIRHLLARIGRRS
jgi:hypothetical protein